jgi:hypothetical protein
MLEEHPNMTRTASHRVAASIGCATVALMLGALAGSPAGGQPSARASLQTRSAGGFSYIPGTRRYRLTTVVLRTQNQAGGRAPFEFTNTTTMDVTLRLTTRARDTLAMTLTVDSVAVSSDLDAPPADLAGYQRAKLTGLISPQGRIYTFTAPAGAPTPTSNLYRAFRRFLVPFPSGEIAAGTTWSDTTTSAVKVGGFDTRTVAITASKIAGDTAIAGQDAWRIERTGTIEISGNTASGKDSTSLSGDGTIRAVDFVAVAGVFLGNTSTQTTQLQQFKPNEPGIEGTPIQQSIKSKVEQLR